MESEYIISLVIYICGISQNLSALYSHDHKHKHRYGHADTYIRMLRLHTHSMSDFYKVLVFCVLMKNGCVDSFLIIIIYSTDRYTYIHTDKCSCSAVQ